MRSTVALALISLAAQGCSVPGPQPPDPAAPEAVVPAIAARFSACDLDALMTLYTPGIEFFAPDLDAPVVGLQALRAHLGGACSSNFRPVMKIDAQKVRMQSQDSAVVTGTYTIGRSDRPLDKPWLAYFVVTLQQSNGKWLASTQATVPRPQP